MKPTPLAKAMADADTAPGPSAPVVLVHGILGQEMFYWNLLRRRLEAMGFRVHEVTLPNLALGDLHEASRAFGASLRDVAAIIDGPMDIVAHSAGGLVVRHHLKAHAEGGRDLVRRLMTLGTPHAGTNMVRLLPEFGMIGQVRPDSVFLRGLNAEPITPGPTCYSAVWTRHDGVVLPAEHARLPARDNVENIEYVGITHWAYLFGPRVARVLGEELIRGFVGGERTIDRSRTDHR